MIPPLKAEENGDGRRWRRKREEEGRAGEALGKDRRLQLPRVYPRSCLPATDGRDAFSRGSTAGKEVALGVEEKEPFSFCLWLSA